MAELFTHVLAGFIIATIASWRYAWITPPMVVACMVGAAIPDRNRLDLILPADMITALTGLPWTWGSTHRAGGALIIAFVWAQTRLRAALGRLASHVVIDYFLWTPIGHTNLLLWPFLDLTVDSQGFYRSSDRWPAVVATIVTGIVLGIDRFVITEKSRESKDLTPAD